MEEKQEIKILRAYKQTNALLVVIGILLGTYTINGTGLNNALAGLVAVLVVVFAAYQYYKWDGKIGSFIMLVAVLWALGYVLMFLKAF